MEEEKQVLEQEDILEVKEQIPEQEDVQEEEKRVVVHEDKRFKVTMEICGASLRLFMEGRLDTTTADGLMDRYMEEAEKVAFSDVIVDMEKLDYLSSAGLRVLLLMRKNLAKGGSFHVVNMNDVIKEIMENTGFYEILV